MDRLRSEVQRLERLLELIIAAVARRMAAIERHGLERNHWQEQIRLSITEILLGELDDRLALNDRELAQASWLVAELVEIRFASAIAKLLPPAAPSVEMPPTLLFTGAKQRRPPKDWQVDPEGTVLARCFRFSSNAAGAAFAEFVTRVGQDLGHVPIITLANGDVTITVSSTLGQGLVELDYFIAETIEGR
jgi:pterin-4a-carbinolamine dehydratase